MSRTSLKLFQTWRPRAPSWCLSVRLYVCQPACLFARLSVCLSLCLFVCQSACLSVHPYDCLFACLSVRLYVCLSLCPSICLSVRLPVCLSVCHTSGQRTRKNFSCKKLGSVPRTISIFNLCKTGTRIDRQKGEQTNRQADTHTDGQIDIMKGL